ncbi:ABC transporter permease [Eubacteriales bacterium KG127]
MKNKKKQFVSILKEIILLLSTLILISVFTFGMVKAQPGDPAVNYLRATNIGVTDRTVEHARNILNLDKTLPEQYIIWLKNAIQGDFGMSYSQKKPVMSVILASAGATIELGVVAFVILLIVSWIMGFVGALYNGKFIDLAVQILAFLFVSIPVFWLGYILLLVFSVKLQILPSSGRGEVFNYILPSICLMIPLLGQTSLFIRKVMLEEMVKPHVENALIRGVEKKYVLWNHVVRNIMIPVVTVLSSNVMYLISGSVLVEEVFSWPGLGRMFVLAVKNGDLPLIQGYLMLFGIMSVVINGGTQKLVYRLNPRMRIEAR